MVTIDALNDMPFDEFVEHLQDIFEHSPWVAERVSVFRPFNSRDDLHQKMVAIVQAASEEKKVVLIQAHPHLGTRKTVSSYSKSEQQNAGLSQLSDEEYERLLQMNETYVHQFDFPFILAVRGKTKDDILQAIEDRLNHTKEQEFNQALAEIYQIARFRLMDQIAEKRMLNK